MRLSITDLCAYHGPLQLLRNVSLTVDPGTRLCLIGPNGSGKTTLLRCVAGLHRPTSGEVRLGERVVTGMPPFEIARAGLAYVATGGQVLAPLTVEENLVAGSFAGGGRRQGWEEVYDLFPVLAERRRQRAGTLSGGERQLVAVARALVGRPSVLLLDELGNGLAPAVADELIQHLVAISENGVSIVAVEHNPTLAAQLTETVHVLRAGRLVSTSDLGKRFDERVLMDHYLG